MNKNAKPSKVKKNHGLEKPPKREKKKISIVSSVTSAPVTPAPVTPASVTPASVTPAPVTPAFVSSEYKQMSPFDVRRDNKNNYVPQSLVWSNDTYVTYVRESDQTKGFYHSSEYISDSSDKLIRFENKYVDCREVTAQQLACRENSSGHRSASPLRCSPGQTVLQLDHAQKSDYYAMGTSRQGDSRHAVDLPKDSSLECHLRDRNGMDLIPPHDDTYNLDIHTAQNIDYSLYTSQCHHESYEQIRNRLTQMRKYILGISVAELEDTRDQYALQLCSNLYFSNSASLKNYTFNQSLWMNQTPQDINLSKRLENEHIDINTRYDFQSSLPKQGVLDFELVRFTSNGLQHDLKRIENDYNRTHEYDVWQHSQTRNEPNLVISEETKTDDEYTTFACIYTDMNHFLIGKIEPWQLYIDLAGIEWLSLLASA